jgi:hypothetical protein
MTVILRFLMNKLTLKTIKQEICVCTIKVLNFGIIVFLQKIVELLFLRQYVIVKKISLKNIFLNFFMKHKYYYIN